MLLNFGYKSIWLHHIDTFLKMPIKKGSLNIHLLNFVIRISVIGRSMLMDKSMATSEKASL